MVKPTAVRAKDVNLNTAASIGHASTNSTISSVLSQQPLQPSNKVIMSSTPSKPSAPSLTSSTSVSIASTNLTSNNSAAAIQPATPFAAVAKNCKYMSKENLLSFQFVFLPSSIHPYRFRSISCINFQFDNILHNCSSK